MHGYTATREGCDGGVRQELAAGVGRVLINVQIAVSHSLRRRLTQCSRGSVEGPLAVLGPKKSGLGTEQ
jgi:hypothetical protein